ncbi:hypothetical protein Q3G72_010769 [Acer saccharum]|nr:hypothetical protein Q3G72_010769 [Acer saccharum]
MDSPNGNNDQEDVSRLSLHPPIRKRKGRRQNISNVDGHEDDASQLKPSKKSTVVQTDSANADDQENAEQSQLHSPSKKHKGRGRMKKVMKVRSSGQKIVVQFNKNGKLRNDQKDRQSHNKYPHRLSRSGYVGLEEELKEIRKEVHEGKISVDGNKDILTMAFGKPEHCGRVRGASQFITPNRYFNIPKRQHHKQEQEKVQELEKMVLQQSQLFQEQSKMFQHQIEKLQSEILTMKGNHVTPNSDHGSCDVDTWLKGKYCKLAVGSKSNVVALGTIMPTDGPDAMVYGIPLNENVRVTIDVAIKGSSLLLIPVWDELITISQAIGSYVAWPREFIIFSSDEFCSMKMISIQCITFYMRYLYEMMKDQKLVDIYVLVDPNAIASCISNVDDRALFGLLFAALLVVPCFGSGPCSSCLAVGFLGVFLVFFIFFWGALAGHVGLVSLVALFPWLLSRKESKVRDTPTSDKSRESKDKDLDKDYKNSLEKEVEFVNVTEIHDRASDREGDGETSMMEKADGENVVEKADSKSVVEKAKTIVATVVESVVEKVDGESVVEKADSKSVVEKAETVVATVVEKVNSESVVEKAEGVGDGEQPICLDDYLSTAVNMVGEVPTTLPSVIHVKFLDPNVEYKNHDKKMGK